MIKAVIPVIISVLSMAGLYGVFEKAGLAGWPALIPGYNIWTAYDIFWKGKYFYISAAEIIVGGCVLWLGVSACLPELLSFVCMAAGGIAFLAGYVTDYLLSKKISDAFGHNIAYAIGLTFFPFVLLPLLGFSKESYIGG